MTMTIPEYLALMEANREAARAVKIQERLCAYIARLNELPQADSSTYKFVPVTTGRRYIKIIRGDTVHAFVEKKTGLVFKAAGWAQPAKSSRYDLLNDASYDLLLQKADLYGGYLYK